MGIFSCRRGYVVTKISSEKCRILSRCAVIRARHRCFDAHDKSFEKGELALHATDLRASTSSQDLSSNPADIAVTLNGVAHIVTPDLARDLSPELIAMLNHSRAPIRKRAILALYKVIVKHPETIKSARLRLEEKLEDPDSGIFLTNIIISVSRLVTGVVAATINVLCELVRHNPTEYLSLAPLLFHLLTTSSNNWMLIKIIKLVRSIYITL